MSVALLELGVSSLAACKGTPASPSGGLEIVVASDMSIPSDIDHIHVESTRFGQVLSSEDHDVGPKALRIPATFLVASTGDAQPVQIEAIGFKSGQPRVERDAVTPIPDGHVGELRASAAPGNVLAQSAMIPRHPFAVTHRW